MLRETQSLIFTNIVIASHRSPDINDFKVACVVRIKLFFHGLILL